MSLLRSIRRLRRTFYDGPAVFNYPGRKMKGYRSPNILIIQWLYAFTASFFTTSGLLLVTISGLVLLVGATSLLMPAYFLSFVLLALIVVDFAAGWFFRPRVAIERVVPESAPANTRIRVDYRVRNRRSRAAWNLYLDTMPLPRRLSRPDGLPYLDYLPGGATATATSYLVPAKRGKYELSLPVIDTAFPFGIWRWGSRGPASKPLIVYPVYTPLTTIDLPMGQRYQPGLHRSAVNQGSSTEFHGCREYRYGDNPRHIHALSWARLREPIIKEFRDEYITRVAVVVDTYPTPVPRWQQLIQGENPQFEASLSLTAAVVEYMVRQDYRIDFFGLGVPPLRGGGGRGTSYLQTVLHLLAGLEESVGEFPGIPDDLVRELQYISAAVVILQEWNDERAAVIEALQSAGIGVRVVLVSGRASHLPAAPGWSQVDPANILAGSVSAL